MRNIHWRMIMNWQGIMDYMTGNFAGPFPYVQPEEEDIEDIKITKQQPVPGKILGEFIERASARRQAGINEYRGGDENLPFSGDPIKEAIEESVDLYVYSREALSQELITDDESDEINCHALDTFNLLRRIEDRIGIRKNQEPGNEED
jgi:hypothetical protein